MKKQYSLLILGLWGLLTVFSWFSPREEFSMAERRPLAQWPQMSWKAVQNGSFMETFEDFTLDQFPLRDGFRTVKSLFHTGVLHQKDNNGIFIHDGYAAQVEYPVESDSLNHALDRFSYVYERYLKGSDVYMALVPDKGIWLSQDSGHLSLDYEEMAAQLEAGMPWAVHIDLSGALELEDYYRTDTHWRQEALLPAAGVICEAMGLSLPKAENFREAVQDVPFYGVYYGQAALPMAPDSITLLENELLAGCRVYDHESGKTMGIYDLEKLTGKDPYEVYLSGARSLLTIENPAGTKGKELIVFRDSFGSAMVPLILADYEKVTLVDIRYIQASLLDRFIDFSGQDVLFLYSTLVLNNSETIK